MVRLNYLVSMLASFSVAWAVILQASFAKGNVVAIDKTAATHVRSRKSSRMLQDADLFASADFSHTGRDQESSERQLFFSVGDDNASQGSSETPTGAPSVIEQKISPMPSLALSEQPSLSDSQLQDSNSSLEPSSQVSMQASMQPSPAPSSVSSLESSLIPSQTLETSSLSSSAPSLNSIPDFSFGGVQVTSQATGSETPSQAPSEAETLAPSVLESIAMSEVPSVANSLAMSDVPSSQVSLEPSMLSSSTSEMPSAYTMSQEPTSALASLAPSPFPSLAPSQGKTAEPSVGPTTIAPSTLAPTNTATTTEELSERSINGKEEFDQVGGKKEKEEPSRLRWLFIITLILIVALVVYFFVDFMNCFGGGGGRDDPGKAFDFDDDDDDGDKSVIGNMDAVTASSVSDVGNEKDDDEYSHGSGGSYQWSLAP